MEFKINKEAMEEAVKGAIITSMTDEQRKDLIGQAITVILHNGGGSYGGSAAFKNIINKAVADIFQEGVRRYLDDHYEEWVGRVRVAAAKSMTALFHSESFQQQLVEGVAKGMLSNVFSGIPSWKLEKILEEVLEETGVRTPPEGERR